MKTIENLVFNNSFASSFPGDHTYHSLPRLTERVLYSLVKPCTVESPRLLAWSENLGAQLGICKPEGASEVAYFSGNRLHPTMYPYSSCYGGHQFGHWANQLGDGRAITLGELLDTKYGAIAELQLKGAGITPYSRKGDGKAVLRSSVREYLMSEAMHYLGIPTTRALSLCTTGDQVWRDQFYDGHLRLEPGAIVTRVAPSFLRFGHFELLSARQEYETLYQLIEWTINHFYPEINQQGLKGDQRLLAFFHQVAIKSADLVVEWMRVGFCHGVMNTDNMSIIGLTIDYGPFSILDEYHPQFTPNTTDLPGRRYAFSRQAGVALWNLERLADALSPMLSSDESFKKTLEFFPKYFADRFYQMMGRKFGMKDINDDFPQFLARWSEEMMENKIDYNHFFCLLMDNQLSALPVALQQLLGQIDGVRDHDIMSRSNPRIVLKNFMLKKAADLLEQADHHYFQQLEEAITRPYDLHHHSLLRPQDASFESGHTLLSCSS